jgi:hypothetical protein
MKKSSSETAHYASPKNRDAQNAVSDQKSKDCKEHFN